MKRRWQGDRRPAQANTSSTQAHSDPIPPAKIKFETSSDVDTDDSEGEQASESAITMKEPEPKRARFDQGAPRTPSQPQLSSPNTATPRWAPSQPRASFKDPRNVVPHIPHIVTPVPLPHRPASPRVAPTSNNQHQFPQARSRHYAPNNKNERRPYNPPTPQNHSRFDQLPDADRPDPSLYSQVGDNASRQTLFQRANQRGQFIQAHMQRIQQVIMKEKEVNERLATAKKESEQQKQELEQLRKQHEEDKQSLQNQLDEQTAFGKDMQTRKNNILAKKRLHKKDAEELRGETATLQEKLKASEDEIASLKKSITQTKKLNADLGVEKRAFKDKKLELKQTVNELTQEQTELKQKVDTMSRVKGELEAKIGSQERFISFVLNGRSVEDVEREMTESYRKQVRDALRPIASHSSPRAPKPESS
ncbi:uncharacterized protein F5Z01DRAFT_102199 [Emericellopsis atlantica]|uniref:Uncharacterized protein n=1 Tax=Emericellopsis atlantica TaxID=2614577 RepID=A0A9P7ZLN7_9HYPO|nr:uncharacterized protein F5Z01DRAFT_102199 [Emericellopsis atlantica]KAG9254305.1 hypothetical protein F5Z01DRAFT_102199 [Emericellopsis atlantica]